MATLAGFAPDPEQRMLLDAAFAVDRHGKSAAFEVVVIAPRQNLKTGFFKQYALGQLFVRNERLVVWSAHEFATAQEALRDLETLIDGCDVLRRRVKRTNRDEVAKHGAVPEIQLRSGARLIFKTRTAGGGRGLSGRKVILDEGYALQPGQAGALMPIMLAQPDPQVCIGSSACRPESAVLWDAVQRGRAGTDPRQVYAEWCAPPPAEVCDMGTICDHARGTPGCACDKPDLLVPVHSAITRGRIQVKTLVDLRQSMPPEEYGREVMGWHDAVEEGRTALPYGAWEARRGPDSEIRGKIRLGVAVAEDHSWAAICAAGDGTVATGHVEVIDYRPGTAWIVEQVKELQGRHDVAAVLLRKASAAGSLISDFESERIRFTAVTAEQYAQACGMFFNAVAEHRDGEDAPAPRFAHLGQPELNTAVSAAKRRSSGDAFVWDQRKSDMDISPLEGVTVAYWGWASGVGVARNAGRGRVIALV